MIKETRIKKGLSQEELAEKIEISSRQMQRIERDESKTKISTLKKIIKELDISDEDIIEFMRK